MVLYGYGIPTEFMDVMNNIYSFFLSVFPSLVSLEF
jgi:hypothetical protein